MSMEAFKSHGIWYKKHLEVVFYKDNGKTYQEIVTIVSCSSTAVFAVCKKFFKSRIGKYLIRVGRPPKFTIIVEGCDLLVLEPMIQVLKYAFLAVNLQNLISWKV